MIAAVREWLVSVVCAAMLIAVAENTAPAGNLRKITSVTGGLILLIVLVRPLIGVDFESLFADYDICAREVELRQEELEEDYIRQVRLLIEQRIAAYISDKAEVMGAACCAKVECRISENGLPVPYRVIVHGTAPQELKNWIRQELDIPEERQVYRGTEG